MQGRTLGTTAMIALAACVARPSAAQPKPKDTPAPSPSVAAETKPASAPSAAASTHEAAPAPNGAAESTPSAAPTPSAGPTDAPPRAEPEPGAPVGGPPQYYVEEQPARPGTPPPESVYEPPPPPPPIYEPPPPAPPRSRAPKNALWVGARTAWFLPFGSLWIDGFSGPSGEYFRRRTFASYASSGPAGEIDLGARLSRSYLVFGIFEHASLGTGSLDEHSFGGQKRGYTNFYGLGLRFSTDPGNIGFALEIALGYREFHAVWSNGTELAMTGGVPDARLGLGADIRLSRLFSLSPMIALGGGSFSAGRFTGPSGNHDVQTQFDTSGEYGTLALQIGGHFDIY